MKCFLIYEPRKAESNSYQQGYKRSRQPQESITLLSTESAEGILNRAEKNDGIEIVYLPIINAEKNIITK